MPIRRRTIGDDFIKLTSSSQFDDAQEDVSSNILKELRDVVGTPQPRVASRHSPSDTYLAKSLIHPLDATQQKSKSFSVTLVNAERARQPWTLVPWLLGAGAVIAILLFVSQYGLKMKGRVIQQGNAAIGSLLNAKSDLETFNFDSAKKNLIRSSEQFDAAQQELNVLGSILTGVISHIPGLASLRTGQDVLKAGKLLSDAGLALSEAIDVATQTGGLLDSKSTDRMSLGSVFLPLQKALSRAQKDVTDAGALLDGIDATSLPEQYRGQFVDLQGRLPVLRNLVDGGVSAVTFLGRMTGTDRPRRYIILFSNPSELRPTGGFPGSYGLITFENGRVKDFRADDIYNPDGQIKNLIVPPLQLQHITPGWGMRDSAWWIDFPTSARKVMQFWQHDGGSAVDGVIAIKPNVLEGILKITGPISIPKYDVVLSAENVVATLQLEVESKKTAQPKQIIVDLAPLILERLSLAPVAQWMELLSLFKENLDDRDALMYFDDAQLQSYVMSQGLGGAVRQTVGDYLMVNISNIKGAKADAVTDTAVKLESWYEAGTLVHRLTLMRRHNGGNTDYGFYNKANNSWVRVLVPKGAVLRDISGNATPDYRPLLDYSKVSSERDSDLVALEATYRIDKHGAIVYEEAGKTGFSFWMALEPGSTRMVQLEYSVPAGVVAKDYTLVVQRQPGLDLSNFEFTIQKSPTLSISGAQPALTEWPESWRYSTPLRQDLELSLKLERK